MGIRKNQKDLSGQEWSDFVDAINKMHGTKAKRNNRHVETWRADGAVYFKPADR